MKRLIAFLMIACCLFGFNATPTHAEAQATSTHAEEIHLPILMYHRILKSRTGKYTVNPQQLDEDFAILKESGFTSVFISEVIDWVDGKGALPTKPIIITFDDGHYNNLYYGLDIAKKHNMKIMINPVTSFSKFSVDSGDHSNPNYSHITWQQIGEAYQSGLVEFGNHTHRMHKYNPRFGIMRISGESDEEYKTALFGDIETAQQLIENSGAPRPKAFAYPFGKFSKESREILLEMGFRALFTCDEWINTIRKGDEKNLHRLGRFNRDGSWDSQRIPKLFADLI